MCLTYFVCSRTERHSKNKTYNQLLKGENKMRITVFGAAGDVGSRIINEAISRGHKVTAVVRKPEQLAALPIKSIGVLGHADKLDDVIKLSSDQDLVISAVRPPKGYENDLVSITDSILTGTSHVNVHTLIVGGAASLNMPKKTRGLEPNTVLTEPNFLPVSVMNIAKACFKQHKMIEQHASKKWTYISPPAMLQPGKRTGVYRLGKNELMYDDKNNSHISMEDFSVAVLDEAEQPKHQTSRFTVGY